MNSSGNGVSKLPSNSYVLDASALLALLNDEPGKKRVEEALSSSVISAVNYGETLIKLIDKGLGTEQARENLEALDLRVIALDEELAYSAASLRPITKQFGLSLGDLCCLALTIRQNATVLTTDRIWSKLNIGAKIELIR